MSDELPDVFQMNPRPAPANLRGRVLAHVERELARRRKPPWERAFELAAAACLAIGVSLSVWQWQAERQWHARVFGPPIESVRLAQRARALAGADSALAESLMKRLALHAPQRER